MDMHKSWRALAGHYKDGPGSPLQECTPIPYNLTHSESSPVNRSDIISNYSFSQMCTTSEGMPGSNLHDTIRWAHLSSFAGKMLFPKFGSLHKLG